jgi:transaldolase
VNLLREIAAIYRNDPAIKTLVLSASIRHPRHIIDSALAGADIATCPCKVLEQSMQHPLTDSGIEKFLADWKGRQ